MEWIIAFVFVIVWFVLLFGLKMFLEMRAGNRMLKARLDGINGQRPPKRPPPPMETNNENRNL